MAGFGTYKPAKTFPATYNPACRRFYLPGSG